MINLLSKKQKTRRSERTKIQKGLILDKAGSIFTEKGYDKTTVRDLARACGFEVGNIYNYFPSKEDILFQVFIRDMTQLVNILRPLVDPENTLPPREKLKQFISEHIGVIASRNSRLQFEVERRNLSWAHRKKIIDLRNEIEDILMEILSNGIEEGEFRKTDLKIEVYSIASIIARTQIWYSRKGRLSSSEISDMLYDFINRALSTNC
jgi:TetR/AcrR family transcriptional regulator, cholesterol catabolism regulator